MTEDKASGGNISLVKNAARDKDGKRKGNFSQVDHSINALADKIGLDGYGIYCFLLNNAGGNFDFSAKKLIGVFKEPISKNRIYNAINSLIDNGLLEREKIGQKGKRPLYAYRIYEISPNQQPAIRQCEKRNNGVTVTENDRNNSVTSPLHAPLHSVTSSVTHRDLLPPKIDMSDFIVEDLEAVIAETQDKRYYPPNTTRAKAEQNTAAAKSTFTPIGQIIKAKTNQHGTTYKDHVLELCVINGVCSLEGREKVIECCRMYYDSKKRFAADNIIMLFINHISSDSSLSAETVYKRVVVS